MTFKELPFKEPIRSDFELIANRIHERFSKCKVLHQCDRWVR